MPPIVRKLAVLLASIFAIITFNFFLFHVIPGDPIRLIARTQRLSPDQVAQMRERLGLNGSLVEQYLRYLGNLSHGDLGFSFALKEPVGDVIGRALLNTVMLLAVSTTLVVVIGVLVGVFAGSRQGQRADTSTVVTALVFWSLPTFWVGMLLVFAFGVWMGGLPISGITTPNAVYHNGLDYVMDVPTITLVIVDIAFFVIITRTSLVEVMGEDYMLTARGKGLSRRAIVWRHGFRNALLPVLTASVLYISALVAGAIQVEVVFSWPGIVTSIAVLVANFGADLLYRRLDPRVGAAR